ncbi:hypothetical protein COT99_01650 [Candidatus Falkowbacteria bacterium CG10_big_fil_rev_8_21_14_0_10_43_10]|uniref:Uncharacterized protein n=1 Tax=Candidatus Falkowbacteria bacterium CG10_big_fil_rev_8_21_14_0_10_43_10 TaxID=1974567 RepID=A0A2H0V4B2_9BACT|nr:MAG: hypothetical protein COT99_01650 [Candidatus Falkowbacteria bacterium CG10_big_fil_rev_8_21_14_0_10_43_10]
MDPKILLLGSLAIVFLGLVAWALNYFNQKPSQQVISLSTDEWTAFARKSLTVALTHAKGSTLAKEVREHLKNAIETALSILEVGNIKIIVPDMNARQLNLPSNCRVIGLVLVTDNIYSIEYFQVTRAGTKGDKFSRIRKDRGEFSLNGLKAVPRSKRDFQEQFLGLIYACSRALR